MNITYNIVWYCSIYLYIIIVHGPNIDSDQLMVDKNDNIIPVNFGKWNTIIYT